MNDRSNEALLARRAKTVDAAHIAADFQDVDIEVIDEILRLRILVEQHEEYISNLELEKQVIDKKIGEIAAILGITPDAGNMRIPGYIKDEILRLKAENARLDSEADWLATQFARMTCYFNTRDYMHNLGLIHHPPTPGILRVQASKAVEEQCKK